MSMKEKEQKDKHQEINIGYWSQQEVMRMEKEFGGGGERKKDKGNGKKTFSKEA